MIPIINRTIDAIFKKISHSTSLMKIIAVCIFFTASLSIFTIL